MSKGDIVIRMYNLRSGTPMGFLKTFDPEAHAKKNPYPTGSVTFTADVNEAMHFLNMQTAMEFYRQKSKLHPTRPDGKPNRPLTAYTAEFLERETLQ